MCGAALVNTLSLLILFTLHREFSIKSGNDCRLTKQKLTLILQFYLRNDRTPAALSIKQSSLACSRVLNRLSCDTGWLKSYSLLEFCNDFFAHSHEGIAFDGGNFDLGI